MNKKIITLIKYSSFFVIGILLIYLVFRGVDPVKMLEDLQKADYTWVIVSFIMGYAAYASRAHRWLLMLKPLGYKPSFLNSLNSVTITYFTNLALPRAGEVARATSLNQSEGIPVDKLLGTILLERIVDMILLVLLIFVTLILRFDDIYNFYQTATSSGGGVDSSSIDLNLILYIGIAFLLLFLIAFVFRNSIKETSIYDKIRSFLVGIKEGISTIKHMEDKWLFAAHTMFIWVMYYAMVYVVFFAIPETSNLTLSDGLFIMAVGALGMVAPVPGGLGAYHGAVMIGLTLLGVEKEIALGFAVIVHTTQTLIALIFGPIALVLTSISKRKRLN